MNKRKAWKAIEKWEEKLSLVERLTGLVSFELILCIWIAIGLTELLKKYLHIESVFLLMLDVLVVSLIIGIGVTGMLSHLFFDPQKISETR